MSMIWTTFKEMYDVEDSITISPTWNDKKNVLAKNLLHYYVYDVLTNYWSEVGTGKIHAAAKPNNRYMNEITGSSWRVALDSFFESSMQRAEKKNIPNPKNEEYVFLNCVYLKTFTALDQLSIEKFYVDHIAPKEQMRKLINQCNGDGLPISCISNLCYLPEYVNRIKREKNFYQGKKYLSYVELSEIEAKYSFTEEYDLEWMDMPYEENDFPVLKEDYAKYCSERFDKLKKLFCESLIINIDYSNSDKYEVPKPVKK